MEMRQCILLLPRFIVLIGMNTLDLNALKMVFDSGLCITRNSRMAHLLLSTWPKVHVKQKTNFKEQTSQTECQLHRQCLVGHRIGVKIAIGPSPFYREL